MSAELILLNGCQNPHPKGHWYQTSPRTSAELGIIVDRVPKSQISHLVNTQKISARLLSKSAGTYEIYGLSESEVPGTRGLCEIQRLTADHTFLIYGQKPTRNPI